MDELIGRLAAKAGVNDAVNEKNIGIIPGFLRSEGFSHNVRAFIDRIPAADAAISALAAGNGPTAIMSSRLVAAGTKLLNLRLGLGMSRIESIARELFRFGHDETGTDGIIEIAPTRGLSQVA